jgi:FMN phosphatase YigB (HAD superfamily)
MKAPTVLVFDLGKVLVDFDYSIAARRVAARSRMSGADIKQFIDHSPLLFRYETGLLTRAEFYQEICAATGFAGSIEEFSDFFGDIFQPIQPMVELHSALRRQGLPTFIFSNTNDIAVAHIRHNFPFFSDFDGYILSYEHGSMKPHAKLYEVVEAQTGRRNGDILYLDDRPENIAAGVDRGWQVILQETPEKSRAAIEALGLLT